MISLKIEIKGNAQNLARERHNLDFHKASQANLHYITELTISHLAILEELASFRLANSNISWSYFFLAREGFLYELLTILLLIVIVLMYTKFFMTNFILILEKQKLVFCLH